MYSKRIQTRSGKIVNATGIFVTNGICLPASCSPSKAVEFSNKFYSRAGLTPVLASCQTDDRESFEALDILAM